MRIVGGDQRGRRLATPKTDAIRPTSDRLREAVFNVLAHAYDDAVVGARVLDLFAGTGALSFEALSRGAAYALLVDEGAEARGLIRENIEAFGAEKTRTQQAMTRAHAHDAYESVMDISRLLAQQMAEPAEMEQVFTELGRFPERRPLKYFSEIETVAAQVLADVGYRRLS